MPLSHGHTDITRGLGVADLACAARHGRPQRAGGELALHVLDIMHAIHEAAASGRQVELATTCERPAPLPLGLLHGELDWNRRRVRGQSRSTQRAAPFTESFR